jgi:3,4-dihydroxy 2-butanone 4-phosphate synthase/GTP cyclohydrolase II
VPNDDSVDLSTPRRIIFPAETLIEDAVASPPEFVWNFEALSAVAAGAADWVTSQPLILFIPYYLLSNRTKPTSTPSKKHGAICSYFVRFMRDCRGAWFIIFAKNLQQFRGSAVTTCYNIDSALTALRSGGVVILEDDAAYPSSAYLICDAAAASPEIITLMARAARGVVAAAVSESRLRELGLAPMASRNSAYAPDFTVTVEARRGVTTGISAADRSATLKILASTTEPRFDLVKPGHIFPLRAKQGGVLVRTSVAEGAVDLLDLAAGQSTTTTAPGSKNVAAVCQCLDSSGELVKGEAIAELAKAEKLPLVSLSQIIQRRLSTETIIERIAEAQLPIDLQTEKSGEFRAVCFRSQNDGAEHLALIRGEVEQTSDDSAPILVRVQAENRLSDLLGTGGIGSKRRLHRALELISETGRGVLVYVRHPRQGLIRAQLALQSQAAAGSAVDGFTPVLTSQVREIGIGSQILTALGIRRVNLLTNSAWHSGSLAAFRLNVAGTVRLE